MYNIGVVFYTIIKADIGERGNSFFMTRRRNLGYAVGVALAVLLCSFIIPAHAKEFIVFAESPKDVVNAVVTVGKSSAETETRKSEEENDMVTTENADTINTVVTVGEGPAVAEANMEADSITHDHVVIDGGIFEEQDMDENIPVLRVVSQHDDSADEEIPVVTVASEEPKQASPVALPTSGLLEDSADDFPVLRVTTYEYPEVPLYFQNDYPDTPYGNYGTVKSHGCGITCVAMVFSYLFDEPIMPDELAEEFGRYNTEDGSYHSLFPDSAEVYGISVEKTNDWDTVIEALENGQVIIANPSHDIFTNSGHFIVLYGITSDGRILVHDPNEYNYSVLNGFENGFEQGQIKYTCMPYYIYPLK